MFTVRRLVVPSKCNKRLPIASPKRNSSSSSRDSPRSNHNTEEGDPIPAKPTWSVHALLASYPRPRISHAELTKLHTLSALVPPAEGSEAAARMRGELEEMVRLVEAVKLVDTSEVQGQGQGQAAQKDRGGIPDGRIWEEGRGMMLSSNTRAVEFEDEEVESGKALLKHAKLTKGGFYVVEADRRKK